MTSFRSPAVRVSFSCSPPVCFRSPGSRSLVDLTTDDHGEVGDNLAHVRENVVPHLDRAGARLMDALGPALRITQQTTERSVPAPGGPTPRPVYALTRQFLLDLGGDVEEAITTVIAAHDGRPSQIERTQAALGVVEAFIAGHTASGHVVHTASQPG